MPVEFLLVVVGLFCAHTCYFWSLFGVAFWFGLWFGVCLVVVVVVAPSLVAMSEAGYAFFQHGCGLSQHWFRIETKKPIVLRDHKKQEDSN